MPTDRLPNLLATPPRAGFRHPGAEEVFVVLAHPPYSAWPWRWPGDVRLFNEVLGILAQFHYLD